MMKMKLPKIRQKCPVKMVNEMFSNIIIYTNLFYGVSMRARDRSKYLIIGSFNKFDGHSSDLPHWELGLLNGYLLRLLSVHVLILKLAFYSTPTLFVLNRGLIKSRMSEHRKIEGCTHIVVIFDHNLRRIIRIGCLFENHPT